MENVRYYILSNGCSKVYGRYKSKKHKQEILRLWDKEGLFLREFKSKAEMQEACKQ